MFSANLVNVAVGRPATQSSTSGLAPAFYAVDGIAITNGPHARCSCTTNSENPWWKVDLISTYRVDDVAVIPCRQCMCLNILETKPQ